MSCVGCMFFAVVIIATAVAVAIEVKRKQGAAGTILILGITALVVVWYADATRQLAGSTRDLATETRTMAQATRDIAEEAPLRHALWSKRLNLYTRMAGTLNLYLTTLSYADQELTPDAEKLIADTAESMAREVAEALVVIQSEEDPVNEVLTRSIYPLREQLRPAKTQQQRDENLRKVAKALDDWRVAVRQSLCLPKLETESHKHYYYGTP